MTKSQHTPGPWQFGNNGLIMACTNTVQIARVGSDNPNFSRAKDDAANTRLIVAAPETAAERDKLKEINAELLEALALCHEQLSLYVSDSEQSPEDTEALDKATATIAKAKGE